MPGYKFCGLGSASVVADTYTLGCSLDGYKNLTLSGMVVTPGNETETEGSMDKA